MTGTRQFSRRVCDPRSMAARAAAVFAVFSALVCSATDLEHRIDALAESSAPAGRGFTGIHVVELSTGKTLYHRNEDRLFLPASNMKLFTSALALLRLGPDHRFTTKLMLEPSGDLALIGSGDPSMSGRVFPYDKDSAAGPGLRAIEDLADQAVKNGILRIDGDVIGDDRLFPWAPYAPSWTQDDALREFGAPASALTLNENTISLLIKPGARSADAVELLLDPALEYYTIDARLITVGPKSEPRIRVSRPSGSRQIELWGSVPAGHEAFRETIAIDDPALYAACALYDALTRRGIAIRGNPVARHRAAFEDEEPAIGTVMGARVSPPMLHLLQVMDKVSQNLFAELMLREVGRVTRRTGTREAGLEEMDALMTEIGATKDESRLEDGSGLSRNTLATPRSFTRLLAYLYGSKYRDDWLSLLPIGGEDGTLRRRFTNARGTRANGAGIGASVGGVTANAGGIKANAGGIKANAGGILAKTGSLSRALALSGYAESKTHGWLAFSILVNDFSAPQGEVRAWIDKIAMTLLD
jgi:D-alanyl-D-alanine carboxypeptidase/D-alanyl-D-alanine-endopeptidase (penicillin-binding protein 4)